MKLNGALKPRQGAYASAGSSAGVQDLRSCRGSQRYQQQATAAIITTTTAIATTTTTKTTTPTAEFLNQTTNRKQYGCHQHQRRHDVAADNANAPDGDSDGDGDSHTDCLPQQPSHGRGVNNHAQKLAQSEQQQQQQTPQADVQQCIVAAHRRNSEQGQTSTANRITSAAAAAAPNGQESSISAATDKEKNNSTSDKNKSRDQETKGSSALSTIIAAHSERAVHKTAAKAAHSFSFSCKASIVSKAAAATAVDAAASPSAFYDIPILSFLSLALLSAIFKFQFLRLLNTTIASAAAAATMRVPQSMDIAGQSRPTRTATAPSSAAATRRRGRPRPLLQPLSLTMRHLMVYAAATATLLLLAAPTVRADDGDNFFSPNGIAVGETTTAEFDYASRGQKKFGDKCDNTLECGFPGSICHPKTKSCKCTDDLPITNHIDKCGKGATVNESCFFNEQCEAIYLQTECRDGRCVCRFDMTPIWLKDGSVECKGRGDHKGPETYVDPAMIGVLIGMALMFIIICVVLRLFSQARWRENRTIFNTPNPRLMNVSLLREGKLLHGQERRGSRMSVRAPSRQPSMASLRPHSPNPSLGKTAGRMIRSKSNTRSSDSRVSDASNCSRLLEHSHTANTHHHHHHNAPHPHANANANASALTAAAHGAGAGAGHGSAGHSASVSPLSANAPAPTPTTTITFVSPTPVASNACSTSQTLAPPPTPPPTAVTIVPNKF